MFRRNHRSCFSISSRGTRRVVAAIQRSKTRNRQLLQSIEQRADRVARWRQAFSFQPLNFTRFLAVFSVLTRLMASERQQLGLSRAGHGSLGWLKNNQAEQTKRWAACNQSRKCNGLRNARVLVSYWLRWYLANSPKRLNLLTSRRQAPLCSVGPKTTQQANFTSTIGNSVLPCWQH